MKVYVVKQAEKEVEKAPRQLLSDAIMVFENIGDGEMPSFPVSRALFGIAKGLFELRMNHPDGSYRVFYVLKKKETVYIVHVMKKKSQKISEQTKRTILARLKGI